MFILDTLLRKYWAILTALLLLSIGILSLSPLDELPAVPGSDKTHHFIAYAALIFPTAYRRPNHWVLLVGFFIGFGGIIELVQPYVNRYGEWLDFLANVTGLLIGWVIGTLFRYFLSDPKQHETKTTSSTNTP